MLDYEQYQNEIVQDFEQTLNELYSTMDGFEIAMNMSPEEISIEIELLGQLIEENAANHQLEAEHLNNMLQDLEVDYDHQMDNLYSQIDVLQYVLANDEEISFVLEDLQFEISDTEESFQQHMNELEEDHQQMMLDYEQYQNEIVQDFEQNIYELHFQLNLLEIIVASVHEEFYINCSFEEIYNICPCYCSGDNNNDNNDDSTVNNGCLEYIEIDMPLELLQGWNMFGYTCWESKDPIDAFIEISDKIEIVKDGWGLAYIPAWGFSAFETLEIGKGYQIKMIEGVTDFQFCPTIIKQE